jgi:hypothetical protein
MLVIAQAESSPALEDVRSHEGRGPHSPFRIRFCRRPRNRTDQDPGILFSDPILVKNGFL